MNMPVEGNTEIGFFPLYPDDAFNENEIGPLNYV